MIGPRGCRALRQSDRCLQRGLRRPITGSIVRRLRDYQSVTVQLGDEVVAARVAAVQGDEARLTLSEPLPPPVARLPARGQLAFSAGSHLVMLSGDVHPGRDPLTIHFLVADGVRQADKRRAARLEVALPARIRPVAGGPERATVTRDVSAGGVLLASGGLAGAVRVEIDLPGDGGTVSASGTVVRSTPLESAVAFVAMDAGDRMTMDAFVTSVRDAVARRFAAAS